MVVSRQEIARNNWPSMIIIGLVALIPVIGYINLLGWMLDSIDESGNNAQLPLRPLHLRRGLLPFAVVLTWVIPVWLVVFLVVEVVPVSSRDSFTISMILNGLIGIALALVIPSLAFLAGQHGFAAVIDVRGVLRLATRPEVIKASVAVALAPLGSVACYVGAAITLPLAYRFAAKSLAQAAESHA